MPQVGCGGSGIATYESLDVRNLGELEHPDENVVHELQIRFFVELGRAISTLKTRDLFAVGVRGRSADVAFHATFKSVERFVPA